MKAPDRLAAIERKLDDVLDRLAKIERLVERHGLPDEVERYLDRDEVGRRVGVSGWTVRQWSQDGRFVPATMIGNLPRWRESTVNAWIADQERK